MVDTPGSGYAWLVTPRHLSFRWMTIEVRDRPE